MFKCPAACILFKCIIKQFPSHDGFPQDIKPGGCLGVRIPANAQHIIAHGHYRFQLIFRQLHIIGDEICRTSAGRIIIIKFLLRQKLAEGIQSLVHPPPLALVAVDDHREKIMPYFVDDHTDHTIFYGLTVGAILFRSSIVEADHRVFHTA